MQSACEICKNSDWSPYYTGPIRDGRFGNFLPEATIFECNHCESRRLEDAHCVDPSIYETSEYRNKLAQNIGTEAFDHQHFMMANVFASMLDSFDFTQKTIADVGCGGGHLLDLIGADAKTCIAIEPTVEFHNHLAAKGYSVFDYATTTIQSFHEKVDFAFSQFVIEHVSDPVSYLNEIHTLLKPGGMVVLCTPNANDIMLDVLPQTYPSFFYRTVHKFYFTERSLVHAAKAAGFTSSTTSYLHRYSMDNAMLWLRDRKPSGKDALFPLNETISNLWKKRLEELGRSDCIYMTFKK